jgi:nucleoside-diphosphate-sugar epimerase
MSPESAARTAPDGAWPHNVVVFGASGFIGRNVLARLHGQVQRLIGVALGGFDVPGVECVRLSDLDALRLEGESVIVHLAAHRYDAAAFKLAQSEILQNNVAIHNAVYRFALTRDITEVRMASSIAVYDGGRTDLDDAAPLDLAADPAASERMYGWSKRIGEIYARLYRAQYGIHTVSFRLSNPYGPHDSLDENKAHVIPAFIMRALREPAGPFTVRGSPAASRDFIAISDVCTVFERSVRWRGKDAVYNVASGSNTTIGDLARQILGLLGQQRDVAAQGEGVSSVMHRRCRVDRMQKDFALPSLVPLESGLRETIAWYRHELR